MNNQIKKIIHSAVLTFVLCGTSAAQVGQVIWQDDFNSINPSIWNSVVGNGCDQPSGCGFGNQELEYYSKKQYQH